MGKYSSGLLEDALKPEKEKAADTISETPIKYSDSVLLDDLPQEKGFVGEAPVNSVFTKDFFGVASDKEAASLWDHIKTGFARSPEKAIEIYSKTRFPDLSTEERKKRYGIHNGEVVFMGDDGKLYRETPDTWGQRIKRAVSQGVTNPAVIMGVIGSFAGPGSAAVGAMGGENIRQIVANEAFDEKRPIGQDLKNIAAEGGLALGGEIGGRAIARAVPGLFRATGRSAELLKRAGPDINKMDLPAIREMEGLGKKFGIGLSPIETTGSHRLAMWGKLLGDMDEASPIIQATRSKRTKEVWNAVDNYLDDLSKPATPGNVGKELTEESQGVIQSAVDARQAKAEPFYERAEKAIVPDDVALEFSEDPIISEAIKKVSKNPVYAKELAELPENSLVKYDYAKRVIDDAINVAKRKGAKNNARLLKKAKDALTSKLDDISPDYKKARSIFADESTVVDEVSKKSIVSDVAKLENQQMTGAVDKFFSGLGKHPDNMAEARKLIHSRNPELWNKTLRTRIESILDTVKESPSVDWHNAGLHIYNKMWGKPQLRRMWAASFGGRKSEQYQTMSDLMKVLKRTSMMFGKESATAPNQVRLSNLQYEGTLPKVIRAATRPLYTFDRAVGDKVVETMMGARAKYMAEILTSESATEASKQLHKIARIKNNKKMLNAFADFLVMVTGGASLQKSSPEYKKDRLPDSLRPSLSTLLGNQ